MSSKKVLEGLEGLYKDPVQMSGRRLWEIFLTGRVCLALILLAIQLLLNSLHDSRAVSQSASLVFSVHVFYLLTCVFVWVGVHRIKRALEYSSLLWVLTLGVDLALFLWLYWTQEESGSFFMLFFFLILMVAALGPRWLIYGVAVVVTLFLTFKSGLFAGGLDNPLRVRDFVSELFACMALIVVGELSRQIAVRMRSEELRANKGLSSAKQQEGLNRLIVSEMSMGVVVGDSDANLKMMNPAAFALITGQEGTPMMEDYSELLIGEPGWEQLQGVIKILFESVVTNRWLVFDFMLEQGSLGPSMLQIKGRLMGAENAKKDGEQSNAHDLCVLFLTDLRDVDKRMRQEKLAAMGRMSASIAHEIRNPLATIGSATALLAEGLNDKGSLRLTEMVMTNVERLNGIVKDVLDAAHLEVHGDVEPIDLLFELPKIVQEWTEIHPQGKRLLMLLPDDVFGVFISFDVEHLRRVIVNFLDNANRYAAQDEASIFVTLETYETGGAEKVRLSVYSDGELLNSKVEHSLFEPFFSTESRGTGLGLYICRNLCERYDATLDFARTRLNLKGEEKNYNEFFIRAHRVDPLPGETKIMLEQVSPLTEEEYKQ